MIFNPPEVRNALRTAAAEITWGTASLFLCIAPVITVIACVSVGWSAIRHHKPSKRFAVFLLPAWATCFAILLYRDFGSWFANGYFEPNCALHLGPRLGDPGSLRGMQNLNEHCYIQAVHAMAMLSSLAVFRCLVDPRKPAQGLQSALEAASWISRCILVGGSALFAVVILELAALFRMSNAALLARCPAGDYGDVSRQFASAGVLMAGGFLSFVLGIVTMCPLAGEMLVARHLKRNGAAVASPLGR